MKAAPTARRIRQRCRRRLVWVTISGILTSTGTALNPRRSSTAWNELSTFSASATSTTARPSEPSSATLSKRILLGAAGSAFGRAGSSTRNCSPFCRCSMFSASCASSYRFKSDW